MEPVPSPSISLSTVPSPSENLMKSLVVAGFTVGPICILRPFAPVPVLEFVNVATTEFAADFVTVNASEKSAAAAVKVPVSVFAVVPDCV